MFQRPQHLLGRMAKQYRVFYIEEPVFYTLENKNMVAVSPQNVWVVTPFISLDTDPAHIEQVQTDLLNVLLTDFNIQDYYCWYYTPMALPFSRHLKPQVTVYDCMDELSAFNFAPTLLHELELELFKRTDIVFTGGYSLYSSKKQYHHNIYPFPSSIEKEHFEKARLEQPDPEDQAQIGFPRMGFFGVLDERLDIELINAVAIARPNWQIIFVGPVVKIDPDSLPVHPNIHYLGQKSYNELPAYISGWDLAMIPFANNKSTEFISPTKTPEYLAAGKPVISSPIRDVIDPYAELSLVHIAFDATDFIEIATLELNNKDRGIWLRDVDDFLRRNSWDITCNAMNALIKQIKENREYV